MYNKKPILLAKVTKTKNAVRTCCMTNVVLSIVLRAEFLVSVSLLLRLMNSKIKNCPIPKIAHH